MIHTKSESDTTSLAPSSPSRSPKRPLYFVQSPSRDSHDGDKSTPIYNNTPLESPSHPSFSGRHSRNSSASRFSGIFRSFSGRKGGRRGRNEKGWPECDVIMEEGVYEGKGVTRRVQVCVGAVSFVGLFMAFCLIIWGASRPFKTHLTVKSFTVHNMYFGEATDFSGVPTKMMTINGSLRMSIYNPATFFGVHVSSNSISLLYSEITIATGQLKKHYQPRKSHGLVTVIVEGNKVPLYGAGSSLQLISNSGSKVPVPLTLIFELRSRGYIVGKLVKTSHRLHVSCPVTVDYTNTKPIKFKKRSCSYS